MNKVFLEACNRINKIDFNRIQNTNRRSDMELFIEFARRFSILVLEHLKIKLRNPYMFNPDKAFGYEIDFDIEDKCPVLKTVKPSIPRKMVIDYLKFAYIIGEGNEVASKNKDVYEPLIKLFERGGQFNIHHGEYIAGGCAWRFKLPDLMLDMNEIDISDEALDKCDNK